MVFKVKHRLEEALTIWLAPRTGPDPCLRIPCKALGGGGALQARGAKVAQRVLRMGSPR